MPRGIPNSKTTKQPAATSEPARLILIQPGAGSTRLDAYGLDSNEIIDELRRALIHLVANQAGVQVISHEIARDAAVVASKAPAKPKTAKATTNGRRPRLVEDDDEIDERELGSTWTP